MKSFRGDLTIFEERLVKHEPFAFSKYADGEWAVLQGHEIDTRRRRGFSWRLRDQALRDALLRSFTYRHPQYFVGIGCPCCMGPAAHADMRALSTQPDANLTWANLWVNANYRAFVSRILPLFVDYAVYLVSRKGDLAALPFPVATTRHGCIADDAWRLWQEYLVTMTPMLTPGPKPKLFLFCAGPLGNILVHRLHQLNPDHTYLDIGSTLDPFLLGESGRTRRYLQGKSTIDKVCTWSD